MGLKESFFVASGLARNSYTPRTPTGSGFSTMATLGCGANKKVRALSIIGSVYGSPKTISAALQRFWLLLDMLTFAGITRLTRSIPTKHLSPQRPSSTTLCLTGSTYTQGLRPTSGVPQEHPKTSVFTSATNIAPLLQARSLVSRQRSLLLRSHHDLVVCGKPLSFSYRVQVLPGDIGHAQVPLFALVLSFLACLGPPERIQLHHLFSTEGFRV